MAIRCAVKLQLIQVFPCDHSRNYKFLQHVIYFHVFLIKSYPLNYLVHPKHASVQGYFYFFKKFIFINEWRKQKKVRYFILLAVDLEAVMNVVVGSAPYLIL